MWHGIWIIPAVAIGLWLWAWFMLNALNMFHYPDDNFRYDIFLRQYVKNPDGTRKYF